MILIRYPTFRYDLIDIRENVDLSTNDDIS